MTTLYCPECGYNPANLPENRCPEFGKAFDPGALEALQKQWPSMRGVMLHLVLVPIVFAVFAPMCLLMSLSSRNEVVGLIVTIGLILGLISLHTFYLSRSYVTSRNLRDGEENAPWLFRHVWARFILFTPTEVVLTGVYFTGGCAVIIMNLKFH